MPKKTKQDLSPEEVLLFCLQHPLRRELLKLCVEAREMRSPKELTLPTNGHISSVGYHVRVLAEQGAVELVAEEPRRGSVEHFYKPTALVDEVPWGRAALGLPKTRKRRRGKPLRMPGRGRKGEPTYYTCGYRATYGDRAAEAVGHGKWQYVREDKLTHLIDSFFATRIFGPKALDHFQAESSALAGSLATQSDGTQKRVARQLGEIDHKIERQLAAIEAGVDPVVVGERIRSLKGEREEAQAVLQQFDQARRDSTAVDPEDARTVLASLPDLAAELADADPELQRGPFEAFRLRVEIDRNAGRVHLRALVSSAFDSAKDLVDIGGAGTAALSDRAIPLRGFEPRFPD